MRAYYGTLDGKMFDVTEKLFSLEREGKIYFKLFYNAFFGDVAVGRPKTLVIRKDPLDPIYLKENEPFFYDIEEHKLKTFSLEPGRSYRSFHFLCTTIGRKTLWKLVASLIFQLSEKDSFTIIFDGRENCSIDPDKVEKKLNYLSRGKITIKVEEQNSGFWGHPILNSDKYKNLPEDFVLFCDDDDVYLPGFLDFLRYICVEDKTYIFALNYQGGIIFHPTKTIDSLISKQSGAIPSKIRDQGVFEYQYNGDYKFYRSLEGKTKFVRMSCPIYELKGNNVDAEEYALVLSCLEDDK